MSLAHYPSTHWPGDLADLPDRCPRPTPPVHIGQAVEGLRGLWHLGAEPDQAADQTKWRPDYGHKFKIRVQKSKCCIGTGRRRFDWKGSEGQKQASRFPHPPPPGSAPAARRGDSGRGDHARSADVDFELSLTLQTPSFLHEP